MNPWIVVYLIVVAAMSLTCFAAYGIDKRQATRGGRRVSERKLQWLAFCGGWPGAIAAQRLFRHKTQKMSFRIVLWLIVALHVAIVCGTAYVIFTSAYHA